MKTIARFSMLVALLALSACGGRDDRSTNGGAEHADEPLQATDRIAVPASVRSNLGVTFVTVERRAIEKTLRVPGRFEYRPTARREYRTAVPGRVELLVGQFDRVEAGAPLFLLDSPAWRETQRELAEARSQIDRWRARLDTYAPLRAAHEQHEQSLRESVAVWEDRIAQLETVRAAGGGRTDQMAQARADLATVRADLAEALEKAAELRADEQEARADLGAATARLEFLLDSAGAVLGLDRASLDEPVETPDGPSARWSTIDRIEVRATTAGVVESLGLTNGSWADERTPVLTVVQPDSLRFRASALQSDLGVLRDGLPARIVPPTPTAGGRAVPLQDTMEGTLTVGLAGDPDDRTIELFVVPDTLRSWARPGVSAQLEIVTDATATTELAVPLGAVQRDGLTPVIFRRNPANPDEVIRVEADLGMDDGRWVALLSGVREGDQVVLDGAFQLLLATSGSIQKGGHFHPDGTFHEGDH